MSLITILRLLRPHQWLKNMFVFLPMFFSGRLLEPWCWQQSIIIFFSFSFMASAVYCLNDMMDVDADRRHPVKRMRPLASGKVSMTTAKVIMAVLILASCFLCTLAHSVTALLIVVVYLLLNFLYCIRLKRYAIGDVFIVSFGFVMRLFAGGTACHIELSPWIVLLTFLLALFLAFAKRRDDVVLLNQTGMEARSNIRRYTLPFLDQTLGILGAMTMMCYIMYTVSPEVIARLNFNYVYISSVFVLSGILRYLQVSIVDKKSGSPTKILMRDRFIQATIAGWVFFFICVLYL